MHTVSGFEWNIMVFFCLFGGDKILLKFSLLWRSLLVEWQSFKRKFMFYQAFMIVNTLCT